MRATLPGRNRHTWCDSRRSRVVQKLVWPHLSSEPSGSFLTSSGNATSLTSFQPSSGITSRGSRSIRFQLVLGDHIATEGRERVAELQDLFTRYAIGAPEEREDLIGVVCGIVMGQAVSSDASELCLGWLHKTFVFAGVKGKSPVANLVAILDSSTHGGGAHPLNCLSDLLLAIQPIPTSDVATWGRVEAYLVNTLQRDIGAFSRVFLKLAEADAHGLHDVICKPRAFDSLLNQMRGKDVADLVGFFITSVNAGWRRLGLLLFDDLAIEAIPTGVLEEEGSHC